MMVSIIGGGAVLEKKNTATRHILTTVMLAVCTLQCFTMFAMTSYIESASVCTTEDVALNNATSADATVSITNDTCVTPVVVDGYTGLEETNLEASSAFGVRATCDTALFFTGSANATACVEDGGEYTLSGCEYLLR